MLPEARFSLEPISRHKIPAGRGMVLSSAVQRWEVKSVTAAKIRILLAEIAQSLIVGISNLMLRRLRDCSQQIVSKLTSPVGRVDCGEGCNIRGGIAESDGVAAVQPTFGVGDEIDLFAAGLLADLLDAPGQSLGTVGNGRSRGLISVEYVCAVFGERIGDAPPIIEKVAVTEENAVNHDDWISGFADLICLSAAVKTDFFCFKF